MAKIVTDNWYLNPPIQTLNDEQPLNNSASVFYLWLLEAFSWFQNGSILLENASCKRRALIIEDEFKNTYFCWLL